MIVLTGASSGLAARILPDLLSQDEVLGLYRKNRPAVDSPRFHAEAADLSDEGAVAALVSRWKDKLSRIVLIHMAAVKNDGVAAQLASAAWDEALRTNLTANFLLTRALLPLMVEQQWGRIVHVSSTDGVRGQPGTIAYAATKSALTGFSRTLAREYARFHVTSNILSLGYFEAGMYHRLTPEIQQKALQQIPLPHPARLNV